MKILINSPQSVIELAREPFVESLSVYPSTLTIGTTSGNAENLPHSVDCSELWAELLAPRDRTDLFSQVDYLIGENTKLRCTRTQEGHLVLRKMVKISLSLSDYVENGNLSVEGYLVLKSILRDKQINALVVTGGMASGKTMLTKNLIKLYEEMQGTAGTTLIVEPMDELQRLFHDTRRDANAPGNGTAESESKIRNKVTAEGIWKRIFVPLTDLYNDERLGMAHAVRSANLFVHGELNVETAGVFFDALDENPFVIAAIQGSSVATALPRLTFMAGQNGREKRLHGKRIAFVEIDRVYGERVVTDVSVVKIADSEENETIRLYRNRENSPVR